MLEPTRSYGDYHRELGKADLGRQGIGAIITSGIGALVMAVFKFGPECWDYLLTLLGVSLLYTLVAAGSLGAGALLFWFRQRFRMWYGITEVLLAAMTAISAVPQDAKGFSQVDLIKLAGATYLVVRGLDNIKVGLDQAKERVQQAVSAIPDSASRASGTAIGRRRAGGSGSAE